MTSLDRRAAAPLSDHVHHAPAGNAPASTVQALDTLARLAQQGRYTQALRLMRTSAVLQATLIPQEAAALEALLIVSERCDAEARGHQSALARAVEREHALGRQLQALTARLLEAGGTDASPSDPGPACPTVSADGSGN